MDYPLTGRPINWAIDGWLTRFKNPGNFEQRVEDRAQSIENLEKAIALQDTISLGTPWVNQGKCQFESVKNEVAVTKYRCFFCRLSTKE